MTRSGLFSLLGGLACGAALMYWLDPKSGRMRRARTRERMGRMRRRSLMAARHSWRRFEGRVTGLLARTARHWNREPAPDCKIRERVRARLGRLSRQVEVTVRNGRVHLQGEVSRRIVLEVQRVPGVSEVEQPGSVPALGHLRHL